MYYRKGKHEKTDGKRMTEFTTMEKLEMKTSGCYGAILKYGDKVLYTSDTYKGTYYAEVYEFVETPEETGLGYIECRLNRMEREEGFPDTGHAIEWAISRIK